jgi:uncharacterized protein YyaL (SSP411 family)
MATETVNALGQASSAYLRSAMHQPVRWHEWGQEVFAAASRENKPILLDIGAVWCHWCHVMDRESYDDPEVAQIINENFIAVKVDRDERPDIDSRYQAAVSAIGGQGGWPLTAFLTPDGKPFYGGTYFPPHEQWGRPSFKRVLLSIAHAYREKHAEVTEQASMVSNIIAQAESFAEPGGKFSPTVIEDVVTSAAKMFDSQHGGFGNAPKFPHPAATDLLIERYSRTRDEKLKTIFTTTLRGMAQGGVYDQLAGGFHRYSTDERWLVPHFEKMAYDNSELLKNYVHAAQVTDDPFYAEIAKDIIRWMDEWLSDREHGGFYASQDADYSMDDDGDYFTWTLAEAKGALSEDELKVASLHYDINEIGEMHHNPSKNVLYVRASVDEIAVRSSMQADRVSALLDSAKRKLYAARLKRPTPYVDKTVYVNWNALCVSAYLKAAKVLHLDDARRFALRTLDRILSQGWKQETGLTHVLAYSDSTAPRRDVPGLLDDYAFTIAACLDAYEATSDLSYFNFGRQITDKMLEKFSDEDVGGFFDTEGGTERSSLGILNSRRKPIQDSPTAAGNPAAAIALLRMHSYTNDPGYQDAAAKTLNVFAGVAGKYGIFSATYAIAAERFVQPHTQVVVIGEDDRATQLFDVAVHPFAFNKTVLKLAASEAIPQYLPPALSDTIPHTTKLRPGASYAVLCSDFRCRPPVSDAGELQQELERLLQTK